MLNEQQGQRHAREISYAGPPAQPGQRNTTRANWIAFGSGLLFSFLTANSILSLFGSSGSDISFPPWTAWIPFQIPAPVFLLLPFALGIIAPITVGIQNKTLIGSSIGRSLLVWGGASLYWFPLAAFDDDRWKRQAIAECQAVNYHGWCGFHLGAGGFFFYLFISAILIMLFALFTALLMKLVRRYSHVL